MQNAVLSFFSIGSVIGEALIVLGAVLYGLTFVTSPRSVFNRFGAMLGRNAVVIVFSITTLATLGSLTFSEILRLAPCQLCWYQRIFMYPQVIILGIGMFLNDIRVRMYSLALSLIGFLIAVYHILVQFFPGTFQCTDEVAKCSQKQVEMFGYITIPVMSATAFGIMILVLLLSLKFVKK